jgi:hypothetical protein
LTTMRFARLSIWFLVIFLVTCVLLFILFA